MKRYRISRGQLAAGACILVSFVLNATPAPAQNLQVLGNLQVDSNAVVSGFTALGSTNMSSRLTVADDIANDGGGALRVDFSNAVPGITSYGIVIAPSALSGAGSQAGLGASGTLNTASQTGGVQNSFSIVSDTAGEASLVGVYGSSIPGNLANASATNESASVGGVFETLPAGTLNLDGVGTYWVGGVLGRVGDSIDGDAGSGVVAAVIGVDENQGTAESYAGYFDGRGHFSGNVGIGRTSPQADLDVSGTGRFDSVVLTGPQGDIPMGIFTNSP